MMVDIGLAAKKMIQAISLSGLMEKHLSFPTGHQESQILTMRTVLKWVLMESSMMSAVDLTGHTFVKRKVGYN